GRRIGPVKLVEDPLELVGGDTQPGVRNGAPNPPVTDAGAHSDHAVVRVLDGVAEHVQEDLLDLLPVRDDHRYGWIDVHDHLHTGMVDEGLERVGDLGDHLPDVDLGEVDVKAAGIDA